MLLVRWVRGRAGRDLPVITAVTADVTAAVTGAVTGAVLPRCAVRARRGAAPSCARCVAADPLPGFLGKGATRTKRRRQWPGTASLDAPRDQSRPHTAHVIRRRDQPTY